MQQIIEQQRDEITRRLREWAAGRVEPADELWGLIYSELRQIAGAYMRNERPDHTLQTTALVNEAYLRLFQAKPFHLENRKHFFCAMAQAMRRILVDHARECQADKRGGAWKRIAMNAVMPVAGTAPRQMVVLDRALEQLAAIRPRQTQVVELRFFAGLTVEETAAVLNISAESVKLDWRFAKAWLQRKVRASNPNDLA